MATRTQQLKQAGQSLWLDNIQRRELYDGTLQRMIDEDGVCGVTSNPTIFMNAVTKSRDYDDQIEKLVRQGRDRQGIYQQITIEDIRTAGKLFLPVYEQTKAEDGFVSIELNPQHAFNAAASIQEARETLAEIGLPNIMIKVPGTPEGIDVMRQLITEGLNVNVTLLFAPQRYEEVALAYMDGLEARVGQGKQVDGIHSVASFFISRIDTKVDRLLDDLGKGGDADRDQISQIRGTAAVNIAKVTYGLSRELFDRPRFRRLEEKGARLQRLLWASTSTKDPAYHDVKYVEELIAPRTINTLPPQTINDFRDHGIAEPRIEEGLAEAPAGLQKIEQLGINLATVYDELQAEGVKAFETSYLDLLKAIEEKGSTF